MLELLGDRRNVIGGDPQVDWFEAALAQEAQQRRTVGVVDLARGERVERSGELVAGREHSDPRARVYRDRADSLARQHAEVRWPQLVASVNQDLTHRDVRAGTADELLDRDRASYQHAEAV